MTFRNKDKTFRNKDNDNVINYPYIDYIIKKYVPEMLSDPEQKSKKINMEYFHEAMQHQSARYKTQEKTYERLEYLGDAIFHMIITEYLYNRYDTENGGFLTKLRIPIERGESMAELTRCLKLEPFIKTGNINLSEDILEDVFEAFIGAFYMNFGIRYTRPFVINLIEKHKNLAELIYYDDNYKDLLQRYFHQSKWGHPIYKNTTEHTGVNSSIMYVSTIRNPFKIIGIGKSATRAKAEQLASKKALEKLGVIVDGEIDSEWLNKFDKAEDITIKDKSNKTVISVFNHNNKLLTKKIIKEILLKYNVSIPYSSTFNLRLFNEAMTHPSYLKRSTIKPGPDDKGAVRLQSKCYERLQLLGDSVIHFVIGNMLFNKYSEADEGFLTRLRCKMENRETLFYLSKCSDISSYILISQHIELIHKRDNVNIIARGFEAFVGVLYLQMGLPIAKQFVTEAIETEINIEKLAEEETNYKERIMLIFNQNQWGYPVYKTLKEFGPDHEKMFTRGLYLNKKLIGKGTARSKKKAEQIASKQAYLSYVKKNSEKQVYDY